MDKYRISGINLSESDAKYQKKERRRRKINQDNRQKQLLWQSSDFKHRQLCETSVPLDVYIFLSEYFTQQIWV